MKFNKFLNLLLFITTQALLIKAENVTFKVMTVNGKPLLNINGHQYEMKLDKYPLYKVNIDIDTFPVHYNYIVKYDDDDNTEAEEFVRIRNQNDESLNEFFNRSITVKEHPELPRAYDAFPYFKQSKLYDDNFVATLIVQCDEDQLNALYEDTETKEKIPAVVIYASPYTVKTFSEAELALSGQSTRGAPKLSYKIKNLKYGSKELYNRSSIKLRAEHMDYSYIRDKIYGDLMNSLGVPTAQNTFARLFINGRDIGFFDLSDDITNSRYLRETFNNGEKYDSNVENPVYKADCDESDGIYGDLGYYGDDVQHDMYLIYSYKGDDKIQSREDHIAQDLIPLLKEIDDYRNGQAEDFSIDKETFLKSMVMEYIGGAIDNYWNKPGNYYLYKDNSKNLWYFHDADFHYSFGINTEEDLMLNTPLSEYPPKVAEKIERERAPLDALLDRPEHKTYFEKVIERLLKTSFNPKALFPRLDSLVELIREDVQWDVSISPKENPNPTNENTLVEDLEVFDRETKSERAEGYFGGYNIRYFIKTKAELVAKELNLQIPNQYENDLGVVEAPRAFADITDISSSSSSSIKQSSWNMAMTFIILLLFLLHYY
ncbi:hypothetical protein LY90DRAFT_455450 [Neocallimastix californiae]|uniref:Coth-domain-containing protein n=1 Tax=Neocallimastix californiae TaxID=1754190 RepID=A0A1Y2D9K7_9FUNG|nr:hypothetical protein LY90DRAFT_455450 [Neocallimastix californiae]|eukprot:ORY55355.1 hypothetical protein LY90DRAFT_455450 [Neocallimastix californiae]